jgi:5,10-methylenetetrahydromethanopterin reductase
VQPWRLRDPVAVQIIIGASWPRNLAVGGRVADGGMIPGMDWHRVGGIVREAAEAAGRDPDSLSYAIMRACVVTNDPERDAEVFKPVCLRMAQMGAGPLFAAAGVPVEVPEHDLSHGDLGHPENCDEAVKVSSQWISDEAALWFARTRAIFGTPEEVVAKLQDLEQSGVRNVLLSHPGTFTLPTDLVEALGTSVLPQLRQAVGQD